MPDYGHPIRFGSFITPVNSPASAPVRAAVKIRHKHVAAMATVEAVGEDRARVTFDEAQRAITNGQGAVFYDGDVVLGGGWIADGGRKGSEG